MHTQPYLGPLLGDGVDPSRFPAAEAVFQQIVSLPLYPTLRDDQVDRVCAAIAGLRRRPRRVNGNGTNGRANGNGTNGSHIDDIKGGLT